MATFHRLLAEWRGLLRGPEAYVVSGTCRARDRIRLHNRPTFWPEEVLASLCYWEEIGTRYSDVWDRR